MDPGKFRSLNPFKFNTNSFDIRNLGATETV